MSTASKLREALDAYESREQQKADAVRKKVEDISGEIDWLTTAVEGWFRLIDGVQVKQEPIKLTATIDGLAVELAAKKTLLLFAGKTLQLTPEISAKHTANFTLKGLEDDYEVRRLGAAPFQVFEIGFQSEAYANFSEGWLYSAMIAEIPQR
ncbi:TPA: hypothetical protein R8F97_001481 [Pseudomonas putida]|nr:hypothetical protein [Pseudomonas putida]